MARWIRLPTPILFLAAMLAMTLFVPFLLIVGLPYAIVAVYFERRRLRAAAESQSCPACGQSLGLAALRLSDDRWQAEVAEIRRNRPGVKLRLSRPQRAICTHCGVELQLIEESRRFAGNVENRS